MNRNTTAQLGCSEPLHPDLESLQSRGIHHITSGAFLCFQSTFSLLSILPLLLHCHLHSFSWHHIFMLPVFFSNIFHATLERSVSSISITTICSHFFFQWCIFLYTLPYCILNVGLEYKYIFLVALFLLFLNFPAGHSFPSSETWRSSLHHIPVVQYSF